MDEMVDYYDKQHSFQTAQKFVKKVDSKIELLKKQPLMGRKVTTMKSVRFVLVDDNRRMYYRIHGTTIFITTFFDTRQNPNKSPYI